MAFSDNELPPPPTSVVDHEHRAVLYTPDGRALVRRAGFVTEGSVRHVQTSGTCSPLSGNTSIRKPKGGKKR
jgi:hypothetical protein